LYDAGRQVAGCTSAPARIAAGLPRTVGGAGRLSHRDPPRGHRPDGNRWIIGAMQDQTWLAERFEANRPHLRGVAYRMLGSLSEADDAVQEAWIRLSRSDTREVENLRAWLTTVVARVSLNMLRSRRTRREASLDAHVPDPIVSPEQGTDPEQEAILGDSVGLAMLVVLDSLAPAERVAFVLHDVFGMPFDKIAPIVDRTPSATRQLASRARRRVRGAPVPDVGLDEQWAVVDAFLAAAREGDFERLLAVLDPDVEVRSDGGDARPRLVGVTRGAEAVAAEAMSFRRFADTATRVLVNGIPGGIAWSPDGSPFAVLALTVRGGRIVRIDVLADPDRLVGLDLTLVTR
jgi:RNA polymerase sigma-70 factor (ECF subfamily)